MKYREISKMVRIKLLEGLIKIRDERRAKDKKYYRHDKKYNKLDSEMKEELNILKNEPATPEDISKKIGISWNTAQNYLLKLSL